MMQPTPGQKMACGHTPGFCHSPSSLAGASRGPQTESWPTSFFSRRRLGVALTNKCRVRLFAESSAGSMKQNWVAADAAKRFHCAWARGTFGGLRFLSFFVNFCQFLSFCQFVSIRGGAWNSWQGMVASPRVQYLRIDCVCAWRRTLSRCQLGAANQVCGSAVTTNT